MADFEVHSNLVKRIKRKEDLEIHVREIEIRDLQFIDIREFIPSRNFYGHGIIFPRSDELIEDLLAAFGGRYDPDLL